jgi:hypothetical protein
MALIPPPNQVLCGTETLDKVLTNVAHNVVHLSDSWFINPSSVISRGGTHPSPMACAEISFHNVLLHAPKSGAASVFANFSSIAAPSDNAEPTQAEERRQIWEFDTWEFEVG